MNLGSFRAGALTLGLLAVLSGSAHGQQNAGSIVARAARVYAGLASLRADFEQRIEDSLIGTFDSRGVVTQAGENRLAMRFSDPAGDAIIIDGKQVWFYTPSTSPGQVIRMPVPTGPRISREGPMRRTGFCARACSAARRVRDRTQPATSG